MSDDPRSPAGASAQGTQPIGPTADLTDDTGDSPSSRGFLGRLFGAFGTEGGEAATATPEPMAAAPTLAAPSLHNLRRLRVDDIAVPKSEIVAAPVGISLDDLLAMFREHGFSRIPVFRDSLDTPVGLIHLKDRR